jgi:soluble lytic murein transglycosylase-like protein
LASLVLTESSFRKNVRSAVGAVGPAQIRPEYWSGFCGIANLHDPAENIYCGAQVLSHLVDRCGDERGDEGCALGAYNIGFYGEREQAARRYVAKVDRYRDHLRNFRL